MSIKKFLFVSFFSSFFCSISYGWSGHGILFSYVLDDLLRSDSKASLVLQEQILPETLEDFLKDTQQDLPLVLDNVEQWSRKNEPAYRPVPNALTYRPETCRNSLEFCFRQAIRINPSVPLGFYVQDFHGQYEDRPVLDVSAYALPFVISNGSLISSRVKPLYANETLTAANVLESYVDEPDFGLDINLYDDNTGHLPYGFGTQPIGLASNPLISQALFHMSTYQEDCFIKLLSPRIKESYPAYRAHLYFTLSRFAKEKGHLYWSYRFAAWGFHYIQDLTQPYHSRLFPDYTTAQMAFWFAENAVGIKTHFENAKKRISNRHLLLEETLAHVLYHHLPYSERIESAVHIDDKFAVNLNCKDVSTLIRRDLSAQMHKIAPNFSRQIIQYLPFSYVNDPDFKVSDFTDYDSMYLTMTSDQQSKLMDVYLNQLHYFFIYSKKCIIYQFIEDGFHF